MTFINTFLYVIAGISPIQPILYHKSIFSSIKIFDKKEKDMRQHVTANNKPLIPIMGMKKAPAFVCDKQKRGLNNY
jgi:hypothetical protein